jgi:hypothetical protein
MDVFAGSTDVTTYFALTLAADGTNATGLTITDLDLQYVRSGAVPVAKVDAVALAAADTAHTDNRAIEIDATDQPGLYRVDWPDAAFASGVREVILSVKHTTCKTEHLRVNLTPSPAKLSSDGLDLVLVESSITPGAGLTNDTGTQLASINARQALSLKASANAGVLAGAATTTVTIKPAGLPAGNTRITATVDSDGNRSALTLKVPD